MNKVVLTHELAERLLTKCNNAPIPVRGFSEHGGHHGRPGWVRKLENRHSFSIGGESHSNFPVGKVEVRKSHLNDMQLRVVEQYIREEGWKEPKPSEVVVHKNGVLPSMQARSLVFASATPEPMMPEIKIKPIQATPIPSQPPKAVKSLAQSDASSTLSLLARLIDENKKMKALEAKYREQREELEQKLDALGDAYENDCRDSLETIELIKLELGEFNLEELGVRFTPGKKHVEDVQPIKVVAKQRVIKDTEELLRMVDHTKITKEGTRTTRYISLLKCLPVGTAFSPKALQGATKKLGLDKDCQKAHFFSTVYTIAGSGHVELTSRGVYTRI